HSRPHDAAANVKEEMLRTVEDVLKSESPKEDFGRRIYEMLTASMGWNQRIEVAREIGAKGIEGFQQAYASPNWKTRREAMHFILASDEMRTEEAVIEMLKRALGDSNKKVRRSAAGSLLDMRVDEQRKRDEFVPLVIKLLADESGLVRRMTAFN